MGTDPRHICLTIPIQNDVLFMFQLGMEIEKAIHIPGMSLCLMKKAYQII
jgi:hypothetical protein